MEMGEDRLRVGSRDEKGLWARVKEGIGVGMMSGGEG